ncbi:hypothetical protein ACFLXU_05110 [Chloroflexota bacterium]
MDFGDIGENLPIIAAVIGLILLQLFLRKRKPETTHQEIVQSLLSEVKLNHALAESYHLQQKPKKFETVSWQRNKNKLDFLSHSLQVVLSDTFMVAEDFNQQIDAAKKYKSASYMVNVNVDKIKGPLAKSKQGLEEWLQRNVGTKEPPPKYPSIMDGLLGGR